METPNGTAVGAERCDAARNRARLLAAARRLVSEHGAEHVTMEAVAKEAGVGKGTLFRRFGDREGLLCVLLEEAEADFHEVYTSGPPPLGPGAPAADRLTAFGCTLIDRIADVTDLGTALARQLRPRNRNASKTGRAFHRHVADLLWEAGVDTDSDVLAHALLAFTTFETADHLVRDRGIPADDLQATWADLVRLVTRPDGSLAG
ncbi:helix-turn-helix domain containing protein [Streptomyces sp. NBS 14/10]|uniref:TetR/AcrR family transcriptional regulator n=1 Tax=Streptomyces sp. NBS 14/10 TaxID=1945643 RepID=UPI000B7E660D|nr:TetR/AcrR family transcriptional regulator [Streptomyces sp. NBS 14/10]KAK1185001.1 helix-turn-helix domain containing protein [Streptomyces sp. NBS 14/10]